MNLDPNQLHVVLSGYRTGSSALCAKILVALDGTNWGECFALSMDKKDKTCKVSPSWTDDIYDKFSVGDVIKIQADTLRHYPEVIDELKKRFDCKFHILYRANIFDQAVSWTKAVLAQEQFKGIRRKPRTDIPSEPQGFWFHTEYPKRLIFDWDDPHTDELFQEKIMFSVLNNVTLAKYLHLGKLYVFEDHFMETRLTQPYTFRGRMSAGTYLYAKWMPQSERQNLSLIRLRCDIPENCIPEVYSCT